MDFDKPEYFINRELSWLKFNERVLSEATAGDTPLLEQLRFIAISSSNLDEFFMVRVGSLKNQHDESREWIDAAGMSARQQLSAIAQIAHKQVKQQYRMLKTILGKLEAEHVYFMRPEDLSPFSKQWLRNYFDHTLSPVLTPLAVDASHPFPFLANRSLNLGLTLVGKSGETGIAVIQVPGMVPRILEVPGSEKNKRCFVFLEDVIRLHCRQLFHGYRIKNIVPFRITRNADFLIDEEEADDTILVEDAPLVSDDYSNNSTPEVESEENTAHAGLSIYNENELE